MTKSMTDVTPLTLGIPGFSYVDLYDPARLRDLSACFDRQLAEETPELFEEFASYRSTQGDGLKPEEVSDLLVRLAPKLGSFVARLFGVEAEREAQAAMIGADFETVFAFKNEIVAKSASRFKGEDPANWDLTQLSGHFTLLVEAVIDEERLRADREASIAGFSIALKRAMESENFAAIGPIRGRMMSDEKASAAFAGALVGDDAALAVALNDLVGRWVFASMRDETLKSAVAGWVSFKTPAKTDFTSLVHHDKKSVNGIGVWTVAGSHHRRRDGFGLTDPRFPERRVLYEVDHCIYCHDRDTDSCSKGMRNKKDGTYKVNPLGVTITGCPLEEKISEMHFVKRQGDNLGALALITIDNPLCPGTGHRI
jgi:hypothetical protein